MEVQEVSTVEVVPLSGVWEVQEVSMVEVPLSGVWEASVA
jgi:hypothetical protein